MKHHLLAAILALGPAAPVSAPSLETRPRPHETVTPLTSQPIVNIPGKRLVCVTVDYPPGAASVPHRHAASAFIYAYVVSGEVRSAVDEEPSRVYHAGEGWIERPGAHHVVSANASDREPARLLAVFVVDEKDEALTTPDGH
jgi:quercetin dioxygenase-like cupin family protein